MAENFIAVSLSFMTLGRMRFATPTCPFLAKTFAVKENGCKHFDSLQRHSLQMNRWLYLTEGRVAVGQHRINTPV
jgi:hypothetical protein